MPGGDCRGPESVRTELSAFRLPISFRQMMLSWIKMVTGSWLMRPSRLETIALALAAGLVSCHSAQQGDEHTAKEEAGRR
jgi:hypothetical protein